jgi:hypothetical protein
MGRSPGWGGPPLVPLSLWALWERGQGGEGRLAARPPPAATWQRQELPANPLLMESVPPPTMPSECLPSRSPAAGRLPCVVRQGGRSRGRTGDSHSPGGTRVGRRGERPFSAIAIGAARLPSHLAAERSEVRWHIRLWRTPADYGGSFRLARWHIRWHIGWHIRLWRTPAGSSTLDSSTPRLGQSHPDGRAPQSRFAAPRPAPCGAP